MPVVTKQERARSKGMEAEGKRIGKHKPEGGAKFPSKPHSADGKYEGLIGGKSKLKGL